ncbi:class I SAM-dependent methyltransferase [Sporomusa sphaeroides]|uniref:Biotin biosynthesis protein BioC n=1 Tax=Sporomusa sphaeroides DSM 2875 TaxID=1337886 RepID=A0ABP2C9S5_9FIRM|nr:class I SAM-dependent methyltransferase [Sporomusa sphaeroides]OLS54472.1 release factor glutamine methyltransferase [Sporomusa sphaeroides DSM 2875]CVK21057.1 biotin biosynthesis protein BioC [Sporomusa sphaeroides DSM 2875]
MNIDYFAEAWKKDLSELAATQEFWNMRADEFNQHGRSEDGNRSQQVIEFLADRNVLTANAEILDIGCGPGRYTLEFAKRAKQVTGLDISPNMLKHATENARQQAVANVRFELSPWETLTLKEHGWETKYDLVFASMCPGISSSDSLLKMCRASKGACFLSSFVEREDELRDRLYQAVYGQEPANRWGKTIYYAFNLLWLSGYYPEVTYHDNEFEHAWPLTKAVELYSHQLKHMHKATQTVEGIDEKITEYLDSLAVDGIVTEKVRSKTAWLYWRL